MVHRVHLQLSDIQSSWSAATPAQDLVDDMITKLNHMVLTACTCLMTDGEDEAKVHDLIDETFIVRLSVIPQSKARFDQCKITKTSSHSSEAGSHKTSHMRDHFEEIGRLARMLKVGDNSEVKDTGRWDHAEGDKVRKIWSHRQSQTFTDLRHTMFKFVTGKHELTRTARLKVYHPVLYHRLDKSKIILALEFGPRLEHILTSCGETDELLRQSASAILMCQGGCHRLEGHPSARSHL